MCDEVKGHKLGNEGLEREVKRYQAFVQVSQKVLDSHGYDAMEIFDQISLKMGAPEFHYNEGMY